LDDQEHGLFATRYPYRPNPLGISTVRLLFRQANVLTIEGVDVLDGTPLLDIKPYVPDFDLRTDVRAGWYETRSKK
jgi:tRNA (Thr-GGU) A37 N-methylase